MAFLGNTFMMKNSPYFSFIANIMSKTFRRPTSSFERHVKNAKLVISPDQTPNVTIRYITLHNLLFLRHSISNGKMLKYIHTIPYHTIPYHTYRTYIHTIFKFTDLLFLLFL